MTKSTTSRALRRTWAAALLCASGWPLSPVPTASADPGDAPHYLMVSGVASGNLGVFRVGADGALSKVPGSPFSIGVGVLSVVVGPDGRTVFITSTLGTVTGYRIGNNGVPAPIPGARVALDGPGITAGVTPDGSRLFVAIGGAPAHISSYAIAATGALSPSGEPDVTIPGLSGLPSLVIDPDGRFLRINSYADGNMPSFAIGPNGHLTPIGTVATGLMPVNPTYSPDGHFLYISHEGSMELRGYAIGADGALTPTPGSPYPAGLMSHGAKITADNRYLYVPEAVSGDVRGYRIGADGALTPLPGSPYTLPLGTMGGSVVISPDQRHVYESDVLTTNVTSMIRTFDIQSDGRLTKSPLPDVDSGTVFSDGPVLQMTH